jgi:hypothetical protein
VQPGSPAGHLKGGDPVLGLDLLHKQHLVLGQLGPVDPAAVLKGRHVQIASGLVQDGPGLEALATAAPVDDSVDVFGQRAGSQLIWHGASCAT